MDGEPKGEAASKRRPRGSLSADEILAAAEDLVERDGLDSLSMPKLARELGAGVTSIYWYFRRKDALLEKLSERALASLLDRLPTPARSSWEEDLEDYFLAFRAQLCMTPFALDLLTRRPRTVLTSPDVYPHVAGRVEAHLADLVVAGLPLDTAARTYAACWSWTHGFAIVAHGSELDPDAGEQSASIAHSPDVADDEIPLTSADGVLDSILRFDDEDFRYGLRALIRGVQRPVGSGA